MRVFQILAVLHVYVGWRLLPDLPLSLTGQILGVIGLVFLSLLIPFGTFARLYLDNQTAVDRLNWAGGIAAGWASSLLILTILRDLTLLLPTMDLWRTETAMGALGLSVAATMVGFFNARRVAKVVPVTITLQDLPAALEGFTIVQLSDVHIGSTIRRRFVQRVVNRVDELDPDAIALTGDIVDGSLSQLAAEAAPLADLRARHGVFLVTGNHEYYHGADQWIDHFRELGLTPLINEHMVIEHEGAQLVIAGINDYSTNGSSHPHVSDPEQAFSGSPEDAPKILLAHQPRSAEAAAAAGADLQLSGHTHGGQIWPWNYLVRLQQPYTAGLHRHGPMWVYTSRGTGYWGPPKRFGAPSEITLIKLARAT